MFTGAEVDWITKTSLPLTEIPISMEISPSEKVETVQAPFSIPKFSQILSTRLKLEFR